jgi:hypothetical protein
MHKGIHNQFRSSILAAVASAALLPIPAAAGETMFKLLRVLKDKGSISEGEYQMLLEAAREETAPKAASAPPAPPAVVAPAPVTATAATPSPAAPEKAAVPGDKREAMHAKTDGTSSLAEAVNKALKGKWYERISFRGYAQLRYTHVIDEDGAALNVLNDSSASTTSSFLLRRGLSGDATDRLFVYAQADFNASLSSGETALGMRDYYGDVALDEKKEFRFRLGQSKVPFGWVNLQSSQNRAPMERADALNSAVEGERDIGAYFYWAPEEVRHRYRDLVKLGLKGSGDYGVVGVGAYSGQGLNRLDLNGEPHVIARVNYPWKLDNGQYLEAGLQAYHGKFLSPVSAMNYAGATFTPTRQADGVVDERIGATFIWYPQPFGVEAEWNVGRGPELNPLSRTLERETLHGGYVQLSYRIEKHWGDWYPFVRWQYFDGSRKFAANAPQLRVNEADIGVEWQPRPEVELTISYSRTFERTNTRIAPYLETDSADRLAFQAQINF